MKKQANRECREIEEQKKDNKVILSMKNLIFKKRLVKKLTKRYMGPYIAEKMVSKNIVKLKLLVSIRIHLVVDISRVVRYRKLVKRQRVEKPKLVKVNEVEKWKVEKILNKRKV